MKHLIDLGHERIAFLSGNLMFNTALRRMQGYRTSLHEHGLPFDTDLVEECNWHDWVDGKRVTDRLLKKTKFTAIFASNLVLAAGAISSLQAACIRIPEDISVIGLHDFPLAEVFVPPLTVVKMPLFEMGRRASLVLISMLKAGADTVIPEILPPEALVVRESTGIASKCGA